MNKLWIIGGVVVAALYVLYSSIYIVNPRQQAIVTRFGEITRINTDPGLYFKVPTDMVESVQFVDKRLLRQDLDNIRLQVKNGKVYIVDAFVTYKITNPKLFRQTVQGSLVNAESQIASKLNSALRVVYGLRDFNAALSEQRTEMMRDTRDMIKGDVANLGIDVVDVRVLRTDLDADVSQQTYNRMKAERLAEAALLRANGQEAAQTLKAVADRQKVEILADAQKESDITRGQGEALRAKTFADAYKTNPEFYAFYRSMQAYKASLDGSNTTMVLAPDSEFFSYFGQEKGKPAAAAGASASGQ